MESKNLSIKAIIMEPVELYCGSISALLDKNFGILLAELLVTKKTSEIISQIVKKKGDVDVVILEPYGVGEDYYSWSILTKFIGENYPSIRFIVWTSKPCYFIKKFKSSSCKNDIYQINKNVSLRCFFSLFCFLIGLVNDINEKSADDEKFKFNLTQSEIIVITALISGDDAFKISKKYNINFKTVFTHKRNALLKINAATVFETNYLIKEKSVDKECIVRL